MKEGEKKISELRELNKTVENEKWDERREGDGRSSLVGILVGNVIKKYKHAHF